jgi:hypothetical protein
MLEQFKHDRTNTLIARPNTVPKPRTQRVAKIVWDSQYGKEVVDEFPTWKEARAMLKEYRLAYTEGTLSIKWGKPE